MPANIKLDTKCVFTCVCALWLEIWRLMWFNTPHRSPGDWRKQDGGQGGTVVLPCKLIDTTETLSQISWQRMTRGKPQNITFQENIFIVDFSLFSDCSCPEWSKHNKRNIFMYNQWTSRPKSLRLCCRQCSTKLTNVLLMQKVEIVRCLRTTKL